MLGLTKVINYKYEQEYLDTYSELIRGIYQNYPKFAEARIKAVGKALNRNNPFLRFGQWENFLLMNDNKPVAHIAAIIDQRLSGSIGLFGFFDSVNDVECAKEILDHAKQCLDKQHRKVLKGPVNLTSWQGFGVSSSEIEPPYFIEPFSRAYYRDLFISYGFGIEQKNITTIQQIGETDFAGFEKEMQKLKNEGFVFDIVDSGNFLPSLRDVYTLTSRIFLDTWSFVNISIDEFMYNFADFSSFASDQFLCIVRNRANECIAFFWGMPDFYSADKRRMVLKVMGALPEYHGLGLGRALLYSVYSYAKEKKITEFILSTMRSDNMLIRNLTASAPDVYREYEVYGLSL